mmetsp:Transcript_31262/g.74552  ORF Transcript_31262/g.74552 Transcript_31262/m.74552 type:complete len:318 (+) Transcript_31262:98-1051(+)
MDRMRQNFIFGYGSLICPLSRAVTAPSLANCLAEPCEVEGIERTWSARVHRAKRDKDSHIRGWTPMGVRGRKGAFSNGVLICVDEEELKRFDVREGGYRRSKIKLSNIYPHFEASEMEEGSGAVVAMEIDRPSEVHHKLDHVKCPKCRQLFEAADRMRRRASSDDTEMNEADSGSGDELAVWCYFQEQSIPADRSFPITQSYIDIILRGCLSISKNFARRFLETTTGWWNEGEAQTVGDFVRRQQMGDTKATDDDDENISLSISDHHTWVDDRLNPMYARADGAFSRGKGAEIDELLKEHHPRALARRVSSMEVPKK